MNSEDMKRLIGLFEEQSKVTTAIIALLSAAAGAIPAPANGEEKPKRGKKKGEEPAAVPTLTGGVAGPTMPEPAKVESEPVKPELPAATGAVLGSDVTSDMIRIRSIAYCAAPPAGFGMDAWSALILKCTGTKKLAEVKPEFYSLFYGTMGAEMDKRGIKDLPVAAPAALAQPVKLPPAAAPVVKKEEKPAASLDEIRAEMPKYLQKMGETPEKCPSARALLKTFGATKLSEIPEEKRASFLEAIRNV